MQDWEAALNHFIDEWEPLEKVTGLLVCGSYVTGDPSKHSDIDLHILLENNVDWRERGNKIVNGYLVEYFANPPKQIREYFENDYKSNRRNAATMFATGSILLDKKGKIQELKKEAIVWLEKEFPKLDKNSLEINKYSLWDDLDNLKNIYEKESKSFNHSYYIYLNSLLTIYSRYLRHVIYPPNRVYEMFTNPKTQQKYLQNKFPDAKFLKMFVKALEITDKKLMLNHLEKMTNYVMEEMGGFNIDGWKIRTNTTV